LAATVVAASAPAARKLPIDLLGFGVSVVGVCGLIGSGWCGLDGLIDGAAQHDAGM
jgi:hypothetical protein